MSILLRSVIDFDETVSQEHLTSNFQKLWTSRIDWNRTDEKKIYEWVKQYFQLHMEMPSHLTVRDYFEREKDLEVVERIKDLEKLQAYIRTNFTHLLNSVLEEQNRIKTIQLFKDGIEIASRGLLVDKEKVVGVRSAISYVTSNAHNLIISAHNAKLRGNLRADGQQVWDEYELAKANKDLVWGKFTGLNAIDQVCHGIKKGELWMHAAYAGELKTTFATNWAYNLVTRYRTNVFYVSLEMTYEHIRKLIYVIHSSNKKFELLGYKPLDYRKVRDGELTPEDEAFFQVVIDDFTNNPEYGAFDVWRPDEDVSIDDVKLEAELSHKQNEIGFMVVDHGGLLEARKKKRNKDYVVELNSVIRDTKKLALNFNHGEAVPILLLFQINRAGKDEADKSEGKYKAKALAYANEAERSADVITTTYLNDEHRKNGTTIFCNLKNRDNPLVDTFEASVDFACRRLYNFDGIAKSGGPGMSIEDNRTSIDQMFNV